MKSWSRRNPTKAIGRIEAFSDSIFGFAITLLVLELLQIPRHEIGQNLQQSLLANWQDFFAFLVGFCTILVCWINHHHLFCFIEQYDGKILWINGALLLLVTFTPFPTSIFSEFLLKENSTGLILFGLTYFLISCVAYLLWVYTYKNNFLDRAVDDFYYKGIISIFRVGLIYTFVAFIVCFFWSRIAISMYVLLFCVFAFPHYFALQYQKYLSKVPSPRLD